MNEHEEILKELRQQEEDLQFISFTNDTAFNVGMTKSECENRQNQTLNER